MTTFKTYLESKNYSKTTLDRYWMDAANFINWTEDHNIEAEAATYNEILAYINHLQKKNITQKTIQSYILSLKHYFNWLIQEEEITENPVSNIQIKGIKKRTLHDILTMQELEYIYNNFTIPNINRPEQILANKRNKVMTGLLIYQGLSTTDLGQLSTHDLKLREGQIYIPGTRKSNERTLELKSHQIMDMMEYTLQIRPEIIKLSKNKSDALFISTGTTGGFNSIMEKLSKKLHKIHSKVSSVNQIRASVITHWLKHYNLRKVQYMAGHRYISSTEAYKVNDLDGLQEDITKYHPIG